MKMKTVKFTRRYTTDVNYEFEEYELTATLQDGESAMGLVAQLKADVEAAHAGEVPQPVSPAKSAAGKKTKVKAEPEEEEEETEEEDEQAEEAEEEDETAEEEEEEEDPKPKKSASKPAPGPGSKKFKKKVQDYQRANETHKEIFSGVLKAVAPNWKKSFESKALAKKVSQKMEGAEFLDESGEVYPSFKETVRKAMGGKK